MSAAAAEARKKRAEQISRISTKVHAFVWVAVAVLVGFASDIVQVLLTSDKVGRIALAIAGAAAGVVFSIYFYLAIYLEYIARIRLSWSVYAPNMIPTATGAGLISGVSFIVALWPVYGLLTPGIIGLLFMGLIMSAHFVPTP